MNRLLMFMILLACAGLSALAARAEPYWVSYDGTDFPENQGWTREYGAGGAERRIEDGTLLLDGLSDILIYDFYSMSRSIDPGPAELFVMRWALRVDAVPGHEDPTVAIFSDESWAVGFYFAEDHLRSAFGQNEYVLFEAGAFHAFELQSSDMRTYQLWMDGSHVLTGEFSHVISQSQLAWGDGGYGAASLSRWDYFEYGVIPEPPAALGLSVIGVVAVLYVKNRKL